MEDIDELIAGTNELLAATSSWLEAVCQFPWNGPEGFLPIIQRSVLKRQFENLETSVFLDAKPAHTLLFPCFVQHVKN